MIGLVSLKKIGLRAKADEGGSGVWSDASRVAGCHKKPGERHGIDSPQSLPTLPSPCVWTSTLWNYERTNFCCFKPPSLWRFVTAPPQN